MTIERRAYPRLPCEYPVQLQDVSGNAIPLLRNSFSKNISELGLKIVSFDFYPVEDHVHIKLYSPHCVCVLDVMGTVVWIQQFPYQEKYMVGLRFTDLGEFGREQLSQLIDSVQSGGPAAEPGCL